MFSFSFSPSNRKKPDHSSKNMNPRRPRRRLERRNAVKNIDYDALASSASSASFATEPASPEAVRATRSLDLSPSCSGQTSFRIGGCVEGEIDLLCRMLGLSGPEGFAIPADAWKASRAQRSSDFGPPRSRLSPASGDQDRDRDLYPEPLSEAAVDRAQDSTARVSENGGIRGVRPPMITPPSNLTRLAPSTTASEVRKPGSGDGGIKGVRPPMLTTPEVAVLPITTQSAPPTMSGLCRDTSPSSVLAPPPSILLPELEKFRSTWDLVRSLAPDAREDEGKRVPTQSEEEQEDDEPEEVRVRLGGETSEDIIYTSNDDDSSSTTTEGMFIISPNGRFNRRINSWMKGNLLGSGSFGTVYEGISDDGFFFAVKEVSLLDHGSNAQQCIVQLEHEIALLSQFEHENIVQYYGTDKEEAKLFIFLELVTQGSLASLYQKYRLRDSQVSAYTRQILKGLIYLHDRNIVHRDIKCANILVHANGSVKLADFGLAKQITQINVLKSCKGSAYWMAPEVIKAKGPYGPAADIWSLGCTVLEMLTQNHPYPDMEWIHVLFKVGRGEGPPIPMNLSKDARDFITQCVQPNPADRPSASQLLEHPFVQRSLPSLRPSPHYASSPANNRWN